MYGQIHSQQLLLVWSESIAGILISLNSIMVSRKGTNVATGRHDGVNTPPFFSSPPQE